MTPLLAGVLLSGVGALLEGVRQVGGRCHSGQDQPAGAAGGPGQPTGNTHAHTLTQIHTLWRDRAFNSICVCVCVCVSSDRASQPAAHPDPEGAVEDPGRDGGSGQKQTTEEHRQQ